DASIKLAERDHWLAFLPWPQALRGEIQLARADPAGAAELLQQAFARACQLGDPCWEGMSARGLALVTEAAGDTSHAFRLLSDARVRASRLADPYLWLDGYILDSQCELGRRYAHPDTRAWVETSRLLRSTSETRSAAPASASKATPTSRSGAMPNRRSPGPMRRPRPAGRARPGALCRSSRWSGRLPAPRRPGRRRASPP